MMPLDVAKKFVKNTLELEGIGMLLEVLSTDDYRRMVGRAFSWGESPEGGEYWEDVSNKAFPEEFVTISLPKAQSAYLVAAADSLRFSLEKFHGNHDQIFDLLTLMALMKYEVTIKVPKKDVDTFCANHGVDFPKYY
jgi:hypothetical protein